MSWWTSGRSGILRRMSTTKKALTRGSRATFYRDGHELHSACDIPAAGAFVVRSLPPGRWVARDLCGGEQAFTVRADTELTTLLEGDVVGASGEAGVSGSQTVLAHNVGPGGGVIGHPDQVAAGETVTGQRRISPGEAPAETPADVPRPDRPSDRPKNPELVEERIPGQAGAGFAQDVPVRSVAEVEAEAKRRRKLTEDERLEEQLVAGEFADAAAPEEVLRPDPVGPEPERPTTLAPGEGASAFGAAHTPLEGRVEGDPQPPLGEEPEE